MPIPTFRLLSLDQVVGVGASAARYVGVSGIAKLHTSGKYTVANEWVCGELAKLLRIPIPPSFLIASEEGALHFVSADFSLSREALPPVVPDDVVKQHPALSAQVVAFDALVTNADRHSGNLASHPTTSQLMVYDHSHALLGWGAVGSGAAWLEAVRNDLGILGRDPNGNGRGSRHCLVDHVSSAADLHTAASRIAHLDRDLVREIAGEAARFELPDSEVRFLEQFMLERCDRLPDLLQAAFRHFPKLDQGSLL